jgi:chromatin remodeling complex protein RSC6
MPVVYGQTLGSCFIMKESGSAVVAVDCSLREARTLTGLDEGKKVEKRVIAAMSGADPEDLPPPEGDGGADEDDELDDEDDEDAESKKKKKQEGEEDDEALEEALASDFHSELRNYFRVGRSRGERGKFAPHSPRLRTFLGLPPVSSSQ